MNAYTYVPTPLVRNFEDTEHSIFVIITDILSLILSSIMSDLNLNLLDNVS